MFDVLIVGAGHGGAQCAIALRQGGFAGSVALLGDEPDPPYERPPLSKDYLSGERSPERLLIRPPTFWAERDITLLPGRRVVAVDPAARTVTGSPGETVSYGELVWATGGAARRLRCEGGDLPGVHSIRSRADVDALRAELDGPKRVVVVGGGYIGLEAAVVLVTGGHAVTVLEAEGRVLSRVAGEPLSRFYEAEHRRRGVDLRLGAAVTAIEGAERVEAVRLGDGTRLPCQLVIVGIGIEPAVAPLLTAGAAGGNGVLVDRHCATTLPHVHAIGDCALHHNRFAPGAAIRLESVQNANDMGTTVARGLTGAPATYDATPWFWSNQYDLNLQTVGLSSGTDRLVVRGDPASRSFSVVSLRGGRVVALDCVNATRDFVQGRKLVEAGSRVEAGRLADATVPLKQMV